MKNKPALDFYDVSKILSAAQAEAEAHNWAVTIAVVDDGGHLLGLHRLDGAPTLSAQLAPAKAKTSVLSGRESKFFEENLNGGRTSFLSISPMSGALLEGGVPLIVNGQVIGAVGVSGVQSHEDAQVARAGIATLAL